RAQSRCGTLRRQLVGAQVMKLLLDSSLLFDEPLEFSLFGSELRGAPSQHALQGKIETLHGDYAGSPAAMASICRTVSSSGQKTCASCFKNSRMRGICRIQASSFGLVPAT